MMNLCGTIGGIYCYYSPWMMLIWILLGLLGIAALVLLIVWLTKQIQKK